MFIISTNEYVTIFAPQKDEFVEKKSVFIGSIAPACEVEEAMDFVNAKKSEYKDATHNVWAYLLKNGQKRYSDDGEPQGTAGVPCLEVLEKSGVCDICVVVTRYFGGILLGGGGLCRAYSHGAAIAVAAAQKKLMEPSLRVRLSCDYGLYGKLTYVLPDFDVRIEESLFEEVVTITLTVRKSTFDRLLKVLTELSNGKLMPVVIEELFYCFDSQAGL